MTLSTIDALTAHGLTPEQAGSLSQHMKLLGLSAGAPLLTSGADHDTLYLLLSGKLDCVLDVDGREVLLGRISSGHWIGEIHLIDGGPATTTVRASETSSLLGLDIAALDALQTEDPDAASALLTSIAGDLARRLRRTSTGLIERSGDTWRLAKPEKRAGWLEQALGWLSGAT